MLAIVAVGSLLSAATGSILNVALPVMAKDLRAGPADAAWFVLSFLLTVTVLLLLAGRLADLIGAARVYAAGFAIFAAGAVGCAVAPTAALLIVARGIQGVGASLLMASSPALLTRAVPPARRGFALGLLSTATYVGLTIGPPLGGELVVAWGWRSIFWATAAVAVLLCALGLAVLPRSAGRREASFDVAGAALILVGTLAFLLVFTRGPAWGLTSAPTLGLAAAWLGSLALFVRVERRHPAPTLDLRLFRSRVFSGAAAAALLNYVTLFVAIYMLPFALQYGRAMDPQIVGRVLAAQSVAMAAVAGVSGALSDRLGARGLGVAGMALMAAAMAGLAWSWPTAGAWAPAAWLALAGLGTGIFISPNSSALMGAAPRERQGIAGGVLGLSRNLGMSLGVAVGSGLFASAGLDAGTRGAWTPAGDGAVRVGLAIGAVVALGAALASLSAREPRPRPG